ncbi:DUF551 domain-containing protein [Klebsiella aerogenes]|jgi:uncharacterized protein YcgL (UPF0745 family)|uniref:DUF551 domain-containing protein n=1 Tax=Klebsiella aerogenes TaxID=548 RepID=UPI0021A2D33D|nr:DUF551 domain-containing protein [Klebsiella aerogenes]MCT1420060.1 DUF551 domain-containing protein [Klebsiella aerogenes]MCT1500763.1 DUF551 domain-containing protein [Klebsiella aerogenes]MCT1794229.1 DUF551 domain-containing protein [Klebsiella aerogenes]MCT2309195.1 DUF551 domain-containing protein [Klebsiella aerogenes]MCT2321055.1 DUF551 domain-containing protein [Klebsiella aerogenes]
MTNNQLTDKRLAQLAKRNFCQTKGEEYTPFGDEVVSMAAELQERRKADSEPVGYFGRFDPDDEDLIDQCSKNVKGAFPLYRHAQPAPVVQDGWIPVSERMPEREVDVQVYCSDKKEQMVGYLERNEQDGYFRYATWRTGDGIYCQPTHWMPLPAAPQEVKP